MADLDSDNRVFCGWYELSKHFVLEYSYVEHGERPCAQVVIVSSIERRASPFTDIAQFVVQIHIAGFVASSELSFCGSSISLPPVLW